MLLVPRQAQQRLVAYPREKRMQVRPSAQFQRPEPLELRMWTTAHPERCFYPALRPSQWVVRP
jgi:hypothetical protein